MCTLSLALSHLDYWPAWPALGRLPYLDPQVKLYAQWGPGWYADTVESLAYTPRPLVVDSSGWTSPQSSCVVWANYSVRPSAVLQLRRSCTATCTTNYAPPPRVS